MKKVISFSTVLFSLFLVLSLTASATTASDSIYPDDKTALKKQINRHMFYPVMQKQQMHGTVEVSFMINPEGKVKVLNINSSNPDLIDYVLKKLDKIKLQEDDDSVGKTIKYRFVFKKQA